MTAALGTAAVADAAAPAATEPAGTVHVVVPADIDDPDRPSGGNVYDRRVCAGLPAAGRPVRELRAAGSWPLPSGPDRAALDRLLAGVPDGADVLLDGLVACSAPDTVVPHAGRLRLAVLVHLPLGDEVGAPAELVAGERGVLHAARTVVATSPYAARRLHELHGVVAAVVTPGVDPAPLTTPSPAGNRLLCLGSVTPTKGQDLLVEALARLEGRDLEATLVGPLGRDPGHVAAVRDLVERHGLAGRVTLPGPRTGPALEATWSHTDLLVLPSRAETYGMVVVEALARGVPVVAAAVGGVRQTLAPAGAVPGLLVPPNDATALATALRRWLDEPALRRSAHRAAVRRRPHLHGWEVTCRCLVRALPPSAPPDARPVTHG